MIVPYTRTLSIGKAKKLKDLIRLISTITPFKMCLPQIFTPSGFRMIMKRKVKKKKFRQKEVGIFVLFSLDKREGLNFPIC